MRLRLASRHILPHALAGVLSAVLSALQFLLIRLRLSGSVLLANCRVRATAATHRRVLIVVRASTRQRTDDRN